MKRFRARDERGFVTELAIFVVVLAGVGAALSLATLRAVMMQPNSTYTEGRLPPPAAPVFIGPALSADGAYAQCQTENAGTHGARWAGPTLGWRAEGVYPEPPASDDSPERKERKDKWFADMTSFMNFVVRPSWIECKGDIPPPKDADPEPPAKINGTYDFESSVTDNRCLFPPPKMQVAIVEKPFTLTLQFDHRAVGGKGSSAITLDGELTKPDLTFRVDFDKKQTARLFGGEALLSGGEIKSEFTMSIRGRFDVFNRRTIIREGVGEWGLTLDGQGGTCRFSYGATRHEGSSG